MWEFVKKHWKWILGIIGLGAGAIAVSELTQPKATHTAEPNVKKLTKEAEDRNIAAKKQIDATATAEKKAVDAQSTAQVVQNLDPATKNQLQGIKDAIDKDIVTNIMAAVDKEATHG